MDFNNGIDLIQSFVNIAPFINSLLNSDFAVSVCDLERCLCYVPGKEINHGLKKGDRHIEGSRVLEAIRTGNRILRRIERGVFPFSYIVIAIPIMNKDNVIGAVSFAENTQKQDRLFEMAGALVRSVENTNTRVAKASHGVKTVSMAGEQLSKNAEEAVAASRNTDEILRIINGILNRTNILGINAAIEASRLGESGRGFMVLSNEIRQMYSGIKESIKKTEEILGQIKGRIEKIGIRLVMIQDACSMQEVSMEEALISLREITSISQEIDFFAKGISGDEESGSL